MTTSNITLIDFYAEWCNPCKRLAPVVEKLCQDNNVELKKIDIEDEDDLANEHNVTALPTFILFRDGNQVGRVDGADEKKLRELFKP